MKFLLIILFGVSSPLFCHGQGFKATYYGETSDRHFFDYELFGNPMKMALEVNFEFEYFITGNENYVEIKAVVHSINETHAIPSLDNFTFRGSQEHVIIDLKRKIIYMVNEQEFYKIRNEDLTFLMESEEGQCAEFSARHSKLTVCDDLPYGITPGIFFDENKGGIKNIASHWGTITLTSWNHEENDLDFSEIFDTIDDIDKLEDWSFLW